MNRNYGLARVTEPDGVAPAAAWKVDNSKEAGKERSQTQNFPDSLEWDNFQQICSKWDTMREKIKARISDLVEKRGKLHNPFTKSGGVLDRYSGRNFCGYAGFFSGGAGGLYLLYCVIKQYPCLYRRNKKNRFSLRADRL